MHILVAEDNRDFRESLAQFLTESEGFRVTQVEDGLEAITYFMCEETIQIVISDMEMPRQNGAELFEAIREELERRKGRFLLVTGMHIGDVNQPDWVRVFRRHAVPILQKPFKLEELVMALHAPV